MQSNLYPPLPVNASGEALTDGYAGVALVNMLGAFVDPKHYLLKGGDLYLMGRPFVEDDIQGGNVVHQRDVEQIGPIVRMVVTRLNEPATSWTFMQEQIRQGWVRLAKNGNLLFVQDNNGKEVLYEIVPYTLMTADGAAYIVSPRPMDKFVLSEILNYPEEDSAAA